MNSAYVNADILEEKRRRSCFARRLLTNINTTTGLAIIVLFSLVAVIGPALARDPLKMHYAHILESPSWSFIFGTDDFGRDLLSRVLHGTRLSMTIGLGVMLITTFFGTFVGLIAGYFVRLAFLMRLMDAMMAFPTLLLAIGLMAVLGSNATNVVIALSVVYTPRMARVVQSVTLQLRDESYVEAARAIGVSTWRTIVLHVLPNSMAPILVQATFVFAYGVLAEAGLSFVGIGVQPPYSTLGNILGSAKSMLREAPWMTFIPGIFILFLVVGFNMLGDGLRVILDPKERGRLH